MAREFAKAFYKSKEWQKCRAGYIESAKGYCERCTAKGKYKPGYIVHHKKMITPMNINDPNVTLNWNNLEYLCHDCHNQEHMGTEATREDVVFDNDGNLIKRQ